MNRNTSYYCTSANMWWLMKIPQWTNILVLYRSFSVDVRFLHHVESTVLLAQWNITTTGWIPNYKGISTPKSTFTFLSSTEHQTLPNPWLSVQIPVVSRYFWLLCSQGLISTCCWESSLQEWGFSPHFPCLFISGLSCIPLLFQTLPLIPRQLLTTHSSLFCSNTVLLPSIFFLSPGSQTWQASCVTARGLENSIFPTDYWIIVILTPLKLFTPGILSPSLFCCPLLSIFSRLNIFLGFTSINNLRMHRLKHINSSWKQYT